MHQLYMERRDNWFRTKIRDTK